MSTEDIFPKSDVLGILIETGTELQEIAIMTVYDGPCYDVVHGEVVPQKEENISLHKNSLPPKKTLRYIGKSVKDAQISKHHKQILKNCVKSIMMLFPLIPQILAKTN